MNVELQKCNCCGKLNTDDAQDWVRVFGATNNRRQVRQVAIDVCASCASTVTVDKLPGLEPKPEVPRPPAPISPQRLPATPA